MTLTIDEVAEAIGKTPDDFHGACHSISLALVRTGILGPEARVARGYAKGVNSQHSWVSQGNPYYLNTQIIDPTLWTYRDDVDDIWYGTRLDDIHMPHGGGMIWHAGRPAHQGGPDMPLGRSGLSEEARSFLNLIEPLDRAGWVRLIHLPLEGWPSAEIIGAILDQWPDMEVNVPVDVIGNLLP